MASLEEEIHGASSRVERMRKFRWQYEADELQYDLVRRAYNLRKTAWDRMKKREQLGVAYGASKDVAEREDLYRKMKQLSGEILERCFTIARMHDDFMLMVDESALKEDYL